MDQGQKVALSGRVYVKADASAGSIVPGDLLTTSSTPGHAMKACDHARAQGAILGKAMTGLKEGQGLVLVLVTLQPARAPTRNRKPRPSMKPQNPLGWIARRLPGEAFGAGLIALLLLASAAAAPAAERKTVNTHVAEVTSRLRPMASLPAANRLHVDIGLPLRNRPGLDALVRRLAQPEQPQLPSLPHP